MMKNPNKNPIKFKVCKGMVCSVDPENEFKQKENGINYVVVERRKKYKPFKRSIWVCADPNSHSAIPIAECYLKPANVAITRFPMDLPEFNNTDLFAIRKAIALVQDEQLVQRLKALEIKIRFCNELRDV